MRVFYYCLTLFALISLQADIFVDTPAQNSLDQALGDFPDLDTHTHRLWPMWELTTEQKNPWWISLTQKHIEKSEPSFPYDITQDVVKLSQEIFKKTTFKSKETNVVPIEGPPWIETSGTSALVDDFFRHFATFRHFNNQVFPQLPGWPHEIIYDSFLQALTYRLQFRHLIWRTTNTFKAYGTFPFRGLHRNEFTSHLHWKIARQHYLKALNFDAKKTKGKKWEDYYIERFTQHAPVASPITNWDQWLEWRALVELGQDRWLNQNDSFALFLREIPERSAPLLTHFTNHSHPQIRWNAWGLLSEVGHPHQAKLINQLQFHLDPIISIRSALYLRRLFTRNNSVNSFLKINGTLAHAHALEALNHQHHNADKATLLKVFENTQDIELKNLSARALLLLPLPPYNRLLAHQDALKQSIDGHALLDTINMYQKNNFNAFLRFTKTLCSAYLARKDKQDVGLVHRSEDFDLLFRLLIRLSLNKKGAEKKIIDLLSQRNARTLNWELRMIFTRSLQRENPANITADILEKLIHKLLKLKGSLGKTRREAPEYYWGLITRLFFHHQKITSLKQNSLTMELFTSHSTALQDFNAALKVAEQFSQQPGHVHKVKTLETKRLKARYRLWDVARRHLDLTKIKTNDLLIKLEEHQNEPNWAIGFIKIIDQTLTNKDAQNMRRSFKSINNPSTKRLLIRSMITLDLDKKQQLFILNLLKNQDPYARYHAHRLLERKTNHHFFRDPFDSKNLNAWIKKWREVLK